MFGLGLEIICIRWLGVVLWQNWKFLLCCCLRQSNCKNLLIDNLTCLVANPFHHFSSGLLLPFTVLESSVCFCMFWMSWDFKLLNYVWSDGNIWWVLFCRFCLSSVIYLGTKIWSGSKLSRIALFLISVWGLKSLRA